MKCPKCQYENPEDTFYCGKCAEPIPSSKRPSVSRTITLQAPVKELAAGLTFAGRYRVIEELGHGGMGKVYKVDDQEIRANIALKLLRPEIAEDPATIERFRNELKLARDIVHKNICRMYDLGHDGEVYYLTMEYVSGEDLKSMIKMSGPLDAGTAIRIAREICDGLAEAHSRGILHRDLKPANIMVDREGHVRIMDFGIARSIKADGLTQPGFITGTPEFMSPEQIEGKKLDQRSDLYSLGVILYEMATGRPPFEGDTPFAVARKHTGETPKDPRELNGRLPADLSALILKCLEKDPERRFQSAAELGAALERIEPTLPAGEKRLRLKPGRVTSKRTLAKWTWKRLALPGAAVAVLVLLGLFVGPRLWKRNVVPALGRKISIAVISFENLTGDTALDYLQKAVPNLMITSLEQSGFLDVITWERLGDLLKQLGKKDVVFIDRDTGFDLCRMEGVETIVLGSIVKAGNTFVTDVKVLDVGSKHLLTSAKATGEGIDSILKSQIDTLSRDVYRGVGLSAKEIRGESAKISDVTTASMEAYRIYLKGLEEEDQHAYESAARYLQRAAEIDPTFAMAYAALYEVYTQLENSSALYAALEKAKLYSARATEKERLYIDAHYTMAVRKDHVGFVRQLEALFKKYPREKRFAQELAIFVKDNDPERGLELFNRALELDPTWTRPLNDMALLFGNMGQYEKSLETQKKLAALAPEDPNV